MPFYAFQNVLPTKISHQTSHAKLNDYHFNNTVLQGLPFNQRGLDDDMPFLIPSMSEHLTQARLIELETHFFC
jgi:hypothetical protein